MGLVRIEGSSIHDWSSFHSVFKKALGFPGFYGENMDAWIDCMSSLYRKDGMSGIQLEDGAWLTLVLTNSGRLKKELPEIHQELIDCTGDC